MISQEAREELEEIVTSLRENLEKYKEKAKKDLKIDDFDIDGAVLKTPNLLSKYNDYFTDETLVLKDLYSLKKKIELERWKYWSGKQTDQYYKKNGIVHEKILKSDIDRYMSADEKLSLVNTCVNIQKSICDHLERSIKEIQSRNFHCKVAVDWRKFTSGG